MAEERVRVSEETPGVARVTLTDGAGHNVVDFELGRQLREALAGPAQSARVVETSPRPRGGRRSSGSGRRGGLRPREQ